MGLFEKIVNVAEEVAEKTTKVVGDAVESVKNGEAGEYIDAAKKKAGDAVELGKKKVEEMKLSNELEKAKTSLGSLVYIMHKTGEKNEELLEQYIKDVADIEAKLEALKTDDAREEPARGAVTAEDFAAAAEEVAAEAEAAAAEAEAIVSEVTDSVDVSDIAPEEDKPAE